MESSNDLLKVVYDTTLAQCDGIDILRDTGYVPPVGHHLGDDVDTSVDRIAINTHPNIKTFTTESTKFVQHDQLNASDIPACHIMERTNPCDLHLLTFEFNCTDTVLREIQTIHYDIIKYMKSAVLFIDNAQIETIYREFVPLWNELLNNKEETVLPFISLRNGIHVSKNITVSIFTESCEHDKVKALARTVNNVNKPKTGILSYFVSTRFPERIRPSFHNMENMTGAIAIYTERDNIPSSISIRYSGKPSDESKAGKLVIRMYRQKICKNDDNTFFVLYTPWTSITNMCTGCITDFAHLDKVIYSKYPSGERNDIVNLFPIYSKRIYIDGGVMKFEQ